MAVTHAMRIVRESQGLNDVTVHDLRRTVRTRMAELRIPKEISARALNSETQNQNRSMVSKGPPDL